MTFRKSEISCYAQAFMFMLQCHIKSMQKWYFGLELVMGTKKLSKVTKSNDLTEANFSDFSLSSYRVFLNLLAKLQHYDTDNNLIPLSLSNRTCSLSASDYASEFNINPDHAYGILKQSIDHLLKTSYSIPFDNGDILKINICSQAYYRKAKGYIDVRFTEEIMPHIAGLSQKFTMYHLNDLAGFNSIYTTRLFELLMQWKTLGEVEISISSLRFSLGCTKIFKLYADFRRKAFGHAVDEINEQLTLDLTYEEVKNGRSVDAIIFRFRPTFVKKVFDPVTQRDRTQITKPRQKTELTPEELVKKEAKRAKEKEYRDRHKAKKMSKLEHDPVTCGCRGGYCEIAQETQMNKEWAEQVQAENEIQSLENNKELLIDEAYSIMAERIAIENETLIPHPLIEELDKDEAIAELKKLLEEKEKEIEELTIEIPKRKKFFGIF